MSAEGDQVRDLMAREMLYFLVLSELIGDVDVKVLRDAVVRLGNRKDRVAPSMPKTVSEAQEWLEKHMEVVRGR